MSVATEFPPVVYVPSAAAQRGERTAKVLAFRAPVEPEIAPVATPAVSLREAARSVPRLYPVLPEPARASSARLASPAARAVPVRLTRRGYAVAALLTAALLAGLIWLAHASAVDAGPVSERPPAVVMVESGDTLWSIASRIAPQRDPRAVVAELERINHLSSPVLQPGQRLRTG
jgi:hypothetical protein